MEISVTTRIDIWDQLKCASADRRTLIILSIALLVGGLLGGLVDHIFKNLTLSFSNVLNLIAIIFFLEMCRSLWLADRILKDKQNFFGESVVYTFDQAGFRLRSKSIRESISWDQVRRVDEQDHYFIILAQSRRAFILAKRDFVDQVDRLRDFISSI